MLLSKYNAMSVGPLWVLRSARQRPAQIEQHQADQCSGCGTAWVLAGSREALIVLPAPLADVKQQTLLQNCLYAAGWSTAATLMLHESCVQASEQSIQILQEQLEANPPRVMVVFGSSTASHIDPSLVRGAIHLYQDVRVIVTHHPEEMIANPALKAQVWADLCLAHGH